MRPIRHLAALLRPLVRDRRAATAVEYGLMLAIIVLIMFVGLKSFADVAINMWKFVATKVVAVSN